MSIIDWLLEQIIEMLVTDARAFVVFACACMFILCVLSVRFGMSRRYRLKRYEMLEINDPKNPTWQNKRALEKGAVQLYLIVVPVVAIVVFGMLLIAIWR
jgi:hypothetical protein